MDHGLPVISLYNLSGNKILKRLTNYENPLKVVQSLSTEDFYWLLKKIGEEDYTPVLKLASYEQWQFLMDIEIWDRDTLNTEAIFTWFDRLKESDMVRLVKWFFSEGKTLAEIIFHKNVEVVQRDTPDEVIELSEDFFTLDSVFYIRVVHPAHRQTLEELIRLMYGIDSNRARIILEEIAALLTSEVEEELYRMRNVRLAEHGFLPFEESSAVYSPLDSESLAADEISPVSHDFATEEIIDIVPIIPLYITEKENIFSQSLSGLTDIALLDRVRLEFAGLCNRIISADGLVGIDLALLTEKCRKGAGCVNIAIENLCGHDREKALLLIENNPIESLFRVGYGLIITLKQETQSWRDKSWFAAKGLDEKFWGERWGMTLAGLLKVRPVYYTGHDQEEYRDFETLSELQNSHMTLRHIKAVDELLRALDILHSTDNALIHEETLTFYALIFTYWARCTLQIDPGFFRISLDSAKRLFAYLRTRDRDAPYQMPGFDELFIRNLSEHMTVSDRKIRSDLSEALSVIWKEFRSEYEQVAVDSIDERYSPFILIG